MATAVPSIACLGVIGRNNNPLHVAIFPSYDPATSTLTPIRTPLQFSLLLSSTLDIFELRSGGGSSSSGAHKSSLASTPAANDFGLLHAVDERLAAYGFETNTGVKFVVVVDMRGRRVGGAEGGGGGGAIGLRETDLKVVFRAMQGAWTRLLMNPFYEPEEGGGGKGAAGIGAGVGGRRFEGEMRRIGEMWTVGVTNL
ncbi:unnamed protein product [Discula destructiva]